MKHKLLSILLCLAMALSLLPTAALADGGTTYTNEDVTADSDGTYRVSNEEQLRRALSHAPTGGTVRKIVLTDNITLNMYYSALLFAHSNTADKWQHSGNMTPEKAAEEAAKPENNEVLDYSTEYDTLAHYKIAVNGWDTVSNDLTEQAKFGANFPMGAQNPVSRLIVKQGQNIILDLNGHTIAKNSTATHGSWSITDTDIIGNYGTLTITDTSTGEAKGTIKGRGYTTCAGAVLHNFTGGVMTVGSVNVNGNAAEFDAGTGQFVIANDGGTITINGTNIYDTATSASLLVNTAGTMTVQNNAVLNHPNTKTINAKGGTVEVGDVTITSDTHAIYAAGGTTNITGNVTIKASAADETAGTLTIAGGAITKAENVSLTAPSGSTWTKIGNTEVLVKENSAAVVNGVSYDSLTEAVAAAKDGETITLVKAVELTSTLSITADKKITLDLNGCKISADMNGPHMICNAGNLTITDSSAAKTGEIAKVGDASNYGYVIENHGTMLLDSCKITSTSSVSSAIENGWYTPAQNTSGTNCTMTIQNAEVTSVNAAGGLYTVKNDDYGVMVINGGIFTNGTEGAGAVLNWNNLTIHNGTFTGTSAVRTLKSGTNDYETGRTYIYDGTFNGKIDTLAGYGENIDVNISGGSFSQPVKEEYCADGFIPKDNGNGTYGVKTGTYAAKIGDTKYESLEVAVSNVTADETITLLQDVPAESVITVARTISFKVDTNKSDGSGVYAFAADTNIIKGNNTTLTTAVESNVYTYSFVYTAPSSSGSSGYYVSTPSKTEHGTVTVSPRYADKGDTVTVTVKPDSGYVLGPLTVTDSKGNELTLTDKGNGKYTFVMPAGKVEVKASFAKEIETSPFADVATDAYYYEAVKWAVGKGITTGVGNDLFAPEQPCTRAQIVTFLWRAAGSPEPKGTASGMTDVVSGSYYEKAVAWAIENGVTTGTTATTFSPDATCTRAQAVTFLARALNAKTASAAEFSDVPADSYFANAVAWASANGVTEGVGNGLFAPDNNCTRGQIVTFLFRAYNK